ncbi:isocitrate lyase/PEP mutase family protein [Curvivirga aplysinae]|uniref:isocitrate lyase/PEP mutase family protein n=1 Tax=Curvivirga aplysinae TaxID=2529852 RepID=UPI0012BC7898|nr:isocitrate lyase/phosphoenolpyruvate mutase family protein [Curvivirga aplysinae]MTI10890.1 oxaloacetate decarboxylase [Curvivirga aplysinae]
MANTTRDSKLETFRFLHEKPGIFVMPNPWDAGSAKILETVGFESLATTSAGYAFSQGLQDGIAGLERDDVLENAAEIVNSVSLPVSADLEDGFGPIPQDCELTIDRAVNIGLVGGSIEDASGNPERPIFEFSLAVERVAAAAEMARKRGFVLTARAENHLHGRPDLDNTIRRLQAFEKAGADVLFAPGLPSLEAIRIVCNSVNKPVNVVMGLSGPTFTLDELQNAGVKRVSVGGSFARAALGALYNAAKEIKTFGTFDYSRDAMPHSKVMQFMSESTRQMEHRKASD